MSKSRFDYYESFSKQAVFFEEMGLNLASGIKRGELGTKELMDALRTVENDADAINHEIQHHLATDFVVPLERGGMNQLANALDDVSDAIQDISVEAYIRCVKELPLGGSEMIEFMTVAVSELRDAVKSLRDMSKNRALIREHCVKVQSAESGCDDVFIESAHLITASDQPFEKRHSDLALIIAIEYALDAAETAAEIVEAIVAENA